MLCTSSSESVCVFFLILNTVSANRLSNYCPRFFKKQMTVKVDLHELNNMKSNLSGFLAACFFVRLSSILCPI